MFLNDSGVGAAFFRMTGVRVCKTFQLCNSGTDGNKLLSNSLS